MDDYSTDTHEMRMLKDFVISDYIIVPSGEYRVLIVSYDGPFTKLRAYDMKGKVLDVNELGTMLFRARKRETQ